MQSRKAQAALEYLMTHGWTILVLTAIIVAIYSLGAFSPSRYMRQDCYFQPDLYCQSFYLKGTGSPAYTLSFSVNNGLGFDVLVDEVNVTATDLGEKGYNTYSSSCSEGVCGSGSCAGGACSPGFGLLVKPGELLTVAFPIQGTSTQPKGSLQQLIVVITYRNCKTDQEYVGTPESCKNGSQHVVSGKITANVE